MRKLLVLMLIVGLLGAGCGRPSEEKAMVEVARAFTEAVASKTFEVAWPLTRDREAATLLQDIPMMIALQGERKIENTYFYVDYLDGNRGSVIATYTQTETVPDVGTSRGEFKMVYEMKKVGKEWKIVDVAQLSVK